MREVKFILSKKKVKDLLDAISFGVEDYAGMEVFPVMSPEEMKVACAFSRERKKLRGLLKERRKRNSRRNT